jgi:hypothetical protein
MIALGVQPFVRLSVYFDGSVWTAPPFNPSNAADQVLRHSFVSWRQWRIMASFASRSTGIRKFDALLVLAAEVCGIVRASYLSPSFPFLLCFELWQYLRRRQQKGNPSCPASHSRRPRWKQTSSAADFPSLLRLVRAAAFAVTLMLPAEGWAQVQVVPGLPPLPAAPDPQQGSAAQQDGTSSDGPLFPRATAKTGVTSADVLKQEERQRILGVVPNFNTVESSAGVPSLSAGQKFHLMYKSSIDPFVFVADAFVAGLGQARNTNPGFGQGAEGYFKRFGASYLDTADGNLWGNAILPIVFKEDPRYFRLGSGTFTHRFLYSAATTVWCKRDNGTWGPNYANVLGNFISGGISNAYYPAADRGVEQTIDGALTVTAEGVIGAEFVEFWPDISRHLFKKHQAAQ